MAETSDRTSRAGARVFSILAEGKPSLDSIDIFAIAGKTKKAVVKEFPAQISDRILEIEFVPTAGWGAVIQAMEILLGQ